MSNIKRKEYIENKITELESGFTTVENKVNTLQEDVANGFSQDMVDAGIQKKITDGTIANLTIENASITTEKLQDEAVTPDKTTFFNIIKKNICPNLKDSGVVSFEDGKPPKSYTLYENGLLVVGSETAWNYIFIKIEGLTIGKEYKVHVEQTGCELLRLLDKNKSTIASSTSSDDITTWDKVVTVTTDTIYVRLSANSYNTTIQLTSLGVYSYDSKDSNYDKDEIVFNNTYLSRLADNLKVLPQNTSNYYRDKKITFLGDSLTAFGSGNAFTIATAKALGFKGYANCGQGGTAVQATSDSAQYNKDIDISAPMAERAMCSDYRINTIPLDTDVLVIWAGTNDADNTSDDQVNWENHEVTNFVGAYLVMLSKIYYKFKLSEGFFSNINYTDITRTDTPRDIQIILMTMPQTAKMSTDVTAYNTMNHKGRQIIKIGEMCGLNVLDIFATGQLNKMNCTISYDDVEADNTHFNEREHFVIARNLIGLLRSIEPIDFGDITRRTGF